MKEELKDKVTIKVASPFKIERIGKGVVQKWKNWYYHGCLKCGNVLRLDHKVTIKDAYVTIEPSIICPSCNAHYLVTDSEVRWV
jgi:hypothetical protein